MPSSYHPISEGISAQKLYTESHLKNEKQRRELREKFGTWTRKTVIAWIIGLGVVLASARAGKGLLGKNIFSNSVLITLLGTTTATVLGLPYIILKGLFPERKDSDNH